MTRTPIHGRATETFDEPLPLVRRGHSRLSSYLSGRRQGALTNLAPLARHPRQS